MKNLKFHLSILIFFLLLTFLIGRPLLLEGFYESHDGIFHLARIAAVINGFRNGNFLIRWVPYFNQGYGHPVFIFKYPLPNYIGAFFYFLGFSLFDSLKIIFFLSLFLSGYFMFLFVREFAKKEVAFLAGFLYIYAPYRLVNTYVRASLGEAIAFVFLPLIFLGVLKIISYPNFKNATFLALSICLLVLSHNIMALIFIFYAVLFFLLMFFLEKEKKREKFLYFCFSLFLGLGLSCFFWLPAFYEAKYTFKSLTIKDMYKDHFLYINQIFSNKWGFKGSVKGPNDEMSFSIGKGHLILISLSIVYCFLNFFSRRSERKKIHIRGFFILFLITSFLLMFPISDYFWQKVPLIKLFEFPWRFLAGVVFFGSIVGAFILDELNTKKSVITAILLIILSISFLTIPMVKTKGQIKQSEKYFFIYPETTTSLKEDDTIWSAGPMEKKPKRKVEIISGKGRIKDLKINYLSHSFIIEAKEKLLLLDNTLYFPGWRVYLDGKRIIPEFQDIRFRGLITFNVNPGRHDVKVIFKRTLDKKIAESISLFSFLIVFFPGILCPLKKNC